MVIVMFEYSKLSTQERRQIRQILKRFGIAYKSVLASNYKVSLITVSHLTEVLEKIKQSTHYATMQTAKYIQGLIDAN